MAEIYHGTNEQNIASILSSGIRGGSSFASDQAFAWSWQRDKVIAANLPLEILQKLKLGRRVWGKVSCTQYTVPEGFTIAPKYLRLMSFEELKPHIDYANKF